MATSRREPHSDARINRPLNQARGFGGQGLSQALLIENYPHPPPLACPNPVHLRHRSMPAPHHRSASSSTHGRTLHHPSSIAAATKHANTVRGKADRSGGTSLWPPALATRSPSSKDTNRAARSPSTLRKSKPSPRPGVEKMAVPSPKLRTKKGASGAMAGGKTQAVSSVRAPGAAAKEKVGAANPVPCIQRTRSVPARPIEAPKIQEQEVELLMEFDEMEWSISTPSIEEHLQEWLPDPVELKHVDAIACVTSQDDPSEPSCNQQEEKNEEVTELISEEKHEAKDNEDLNGGENADVGINSQVHVVKEAADEEELKEAVDEAEVNEVVSETGLKDAVNETKLKESVVEPELVVEKEVKEKAENVMPPKKTLELVQGWKKDDGRSNEVKRKSRVMALIGKFETAMAGRE